MDINKVSIVILNWNGADMLRQFLPSVVRSVSGLPGVEVCVADNGSTDSSVEVIRNEFPGVRLIGMKENSGFADGYNKALRQVQAEYVVLLNSDVEVTPGWLAPLTEFMDAHPEVAACQPKLLSFRKRDHFEYAGAAGGYIDRYGYPFCRGRIFGEVETDHGQYDTVSPVFWATGAALFIRLADYWEAGGLDGRFFAHMEEIDLCWRLHLLGREIVCVPQSVVYHVGGATLKKENPRKTYLNFRNNLLMLYKNLSDHELRPVMRMRWLLDGVAWLVFLLKADVANARAVRQARKDFQRMCPDFAADRALIRQRAVATVLSGQWRFSLLWQFYVNRRKRFSDFR